MTPREQALFEAHKQRALKAESAINRIRSYIDMESSKFGIRSIERSTIGCICDTNIADRMLINEDFCRQFPD